MGVGVIAQKDGPFDTRMFFLARVVEPIGRMSYLSDRLHGIHANNYRMRSTARLGDDFIDYIIKADRVRIFWVFSAELAYQYLIESLFRISFENERNTAGIGFFILAQPLMKCLRMRLDLESPAIKSNRYSPTESPRSWDVPTKDFALLLAMF